MSQYLYLHMKIKCQKFHIETPFILKISACEICEKFVYKHSEKMEHVKN